MKKTVVLLSRLPHGRDRFRKAEVSPLGDDSWPWSHVPKERTKKSGVVGEPAGSKITFLRQFGVCPHYSSNQIDCNHLRKTSFIHLFQHNIQRCVSQDPKWHRLEIYVRSGIFKTVTLYET